MQLGSIFIKSLIPSIKVMFIVFFLMVAIEYFQLKYREFFTKFLRENKTFQYIISSFLGVIPGCGATFMVDSLYMAGAIGFGGINSVMVATSGDEAFLLLGYAFKDTTGKTLKVVLFLFFVLFILGIIAGYVADFVVKKFNLKLCKDKCLIYHDVDKKDSDFSDFYKHFLKEHVYNHIIKKHLAKLFLWLFFSIFFINILNSSFNLKTVVHHYKFVVLFLAAIIGLLPISGPNMMFVSMFVSGLVPFSVMLTNSIVQDGHGLLPLLAFSLEDSFKIKLFNFIFGLIVGYIIMLFGF